MMPSLPDASIAMACYRMGREVPRTLLSLAPPYQRNCPPGRIEVILVDNGSPQPPDISEAVGLGLDVTLHHWPDASPSPVAAMNFAIAQARSPLICACIDGARMVSPGLVDACIAAARLHPRPIVATENYQLGPDLQPLSIPKGYDAAEEDRLLASIGWPGEGADLFKIATQDRYVSNEHGILECNALFMTRELWDELGGYDPLFVSPGGGGCNPDVFARACGLPQTQLIRVRGEATFHQIHGGITTNVDGRVTPAMIAFGAEYFRIRRRPMAKARRKAWVFDAATRQLDKGEG